MRIVTLEPPSHQGQGDHIYRTLEPSLHLAAISDVYALCGTWLSPLARSAAEDADVLILCQAVDADFLPLMARRRARGLTTIVEFNDHFLSPHANKPVAAFYANPVNSSLAFQLASLADGLQLSTQALAAVFGHLNAKQAVFPNAVTERLYQRGAKAPRHHGDARLGLRLGWAGSHGHLKDLEWLMPALRDIVARHPLVTLCIMATSALKPLFDWVPHAQLQWRDAGTLHDYQTFLETLDIGLAPLCATPFNDCRSDVKYLEYAMAGVPGVFSARPAYTSSVEDEATGLLAETTGQFIAQIERLIASAKLRDTLARTAQRQILAKRLGAQAAQARLAFWRGLTPDAGAPYAQPQPPSWGTRLCAASRRAERAWVIPLGGAEADLYDGLLLGPSPDGRAHLMRASAQAADNYLCWLYLAQASLDAKVIEEALERAFALQPGSLSVCLALAEHHFKTGASAEARRILGTRDDPSHAAYSFAPLDELRGRINLAQGDYDAAEHAFTKALQHNPWYRTPATRLAQMYLERGKAAEAERLLCDTIGKDCAHWLDYFLLGELLRQRGLWRRAKQQFEAAKRRGAPAEQIGARLAQSCAALGDKCGTQRALAWTRAATKAAAPTC